jgi:twitching motility two-component system response regulator PilG
MLLREGIAAARAGDKEQTRRLLREVTELEPDNEVAWLWLAGVAEAHEDALEAIERVLEINPDNDRAREGVKSARLQVAVAAARAGDRETARDHLRLLTEQDPNNELAWMWLAGVADRPQETVAHLQRVLSLNPGNDRAREGLRAARLQAASAEANAGNRSAARGYVLPLTEQEPNNETAWQWLASVTESPVEALAAWKKVLEINPRHPQAKEAVQKLQVRVARAPVTPAPEGRSGPPLRVLVVDDSPTVRKLVAMALEKHGCVVVPAADGYEAADQMLRRPPDLILLDTTMPGMDGYQVCKLIKENPETSKIPVVMLSGKDGFFDKIRGRLAGSTAYITKPFKPETLIPVVEKYCRRSPRAG